MQDILPAGGARGAAAFRATDVPVPPTNYEADLDAAGAHPPASTSSMSTVAGTSDEASASSANVMPSITGTSDDIIMSSASPAPTRPCPLPMPSTSATPSWLTLSTTSSAAKCSRDATSMFHDDATTFTSTAPSSTSEQVQQFQAPALKKQKLRASQSHAGTQSCTGSGQSVMMTSAARAAKITPAAAVMGMQGSINRLTNVIEKGMITDAERVEKQRHATLRILNNEDTDYPMQERVVVMHMFADDPAVVDIYLETQDKDTQHTFIQHMIQYRFQQIPQAPQMPYARPQIGQ